MLSIGWYGQDLCDFGYICVSHKKYVTPTRTFFLNVVFCAKQVSKKKDQKKIYDSLVSYEILF